MLSYNRLYEKINLGKVLEQKNGNLFCFSSKMGSFLILGCMGVFFIDSGAYNVMLSQLILGVLA